jgi:Transposase DNA-binding
MKLSPLLPGRRTSNDRVSEDETWVDREVAECKFQDVRLGERFRKLLKQIGGAIGQAIPFACQDWANTKAAYRFFSNDRVDEEAILSGHFEATHDRFAATDGYVLVLHDTTEFTFKREKPELIGSTCIVNGKDEGARHIRCCLRDSDAFKPGGDNGRASSRLGGH